LGGTTVLGWVGPPTLVTPAVEPALLISSIQATSHYENWGELQGTVHVGDCAIRPGDGLVAKEYMIEAILDGADENVPESYSMPLILRTSIKFGDVVGASVDLPPDNSTNFRDVHALVIAFAGWQQTASVAWLDLAPQVPDTVVNFADVFVAVTGFQTDGAGYSFVADPCDCPGACP